MRGRSLGAGRQSFVSGRHRYGWLVFGLVMLVFGVVFLVTAFTMSDPPRRFGLAVVFLLLTAVSVQFSRADLVIDRQAGVVRVRNLLTTVTVPLADIAGFEPYPERTTYTSGSWGWYLVRLRRRDGSTVLCHGLTGAGARDAQRMAGYLNQSADLNASATLPAAKVPDVTRQAAESAVRISDINQGIAEFAASLGKAHGGLTQAEIDVFIRERKLWESRHSDTQDDQLA